VCERVSIIIMKEISFKVLTVLHIFSPHYNEKLFSFIPSLHLDAHLSRA
jgi:hypothetical protein